MYLVAPIQRLITPNLSQNRRRFVFWNMKNDVIMFLKKKSPDLRSDAEREHKFINKNQNTICSNYLVDSRGVQKPYKCVRATLCSLHTVVGARSLISAHPWSIASIFLDAVQWKCSNEYWYYTHYLHV